MATFICLLPYDKKIIYGNLIKVMIDSLAIFIVKYLFYEIAYFKKFP